ncbi:hypothetical protein P153DRAFT_386076 [Dothidotthia symphoricarpi CBS 119687]|uniref:AA1-like domain-containing protein n=1 Tax=Dothidotthia symphoricarpi CBS 119687 TaxID=1392245 RepID=A0A6A6AD23_9PLEO|nr:uncharacterized protein P153DRAFT_386076 [Dothidotthia symphoricarpi CBS 119687]KAF2128874.1 hypothetical protein P153DRAFT_386076 [Dothidotthia symphoricarpi CBS 119687]
MIPLTSLVLSILSTISSSLALPHPHKTMLNTAFARDIGIAYSLPNLTGSAEYLLQTKHGKSCMPLRNGDDVLSITVCKPVSCTFFVEYGCYNKPSNHNISITITGPGDVLVVETPVGNHFRSYVCGPAQTGGGASGAGFQLETTPHDRSRGEEGGV